MKFAKVGSFLLLVVGLAALPAFAEIQPNAISLSLAPETAIDSGDDLTLTVSDLLPGSAVMLVVSQTQGTSQMGQINVDLLPPYIFFLGGLASVSGQVVSHQHFDTIPQDLQGEVFHVQALAAKVNNGPLGAEIDFYASNIKSFMFGS